MVDSYDVTIFPAESIKNTVSKKAKLKTARQELLGIDNNYTTWFTDLEGKLMFRGLLNLQVQIDNNF